ncbi:Ger(x)C family spore germination protein [Paenibacillus provencensis]|uniref:Ger(X)C family spore germination protein n=1 Tax=Paenibacillus provencensis TaxID=441151 RepID=A0ABW3PUS1_9BACL|nr:Ger(x)C family spore germination protein [Paenibacillus sp. MER 78]MCM3130453.1 Ger(x)C family spore germination protein [Paenibacillus sp. MER 78]
MNNLRNTIKLMAIFFLTVCMTGCWNSREIEDLRVYVGVGLDVADETKFEKKVNERGGHYPKKNVLTATVQIVPGTKEQAAQGQGGQAGESYLNERLTGDSLLQIFRQFSLRRDRPLIGHHLKVIVISSELATKYSLEQLLDFILRDNDIRPSALVLISQQKAIDVLSANQPGEVPAFNLRGLVRNRQRTNRILPAISLGKLEGLMQSRQSFVLQNVIMAENELKFVGGALFEGDTNKYIGRLNQVDVEAISWIEGNPGGVLKTYTDEGDTIVYEIASISSKITPKLEGDELSIHIDVQSKGRLIEDWSYPEESTDSAYIEEQEEKFNETVKNEIKTLLDKLQHTYRVDVVGFGKEVRIKYPRYYNKVKDRWDEVFSEIPVTYDVDLEIIDYGSTLE